LEFSAPVFNKLHSLHTTENTLLVHREIEEGEVVVAWTGRIVTYKEMLALPEDERDYYFQIDEDLFQVPFNHGEREPAVSVPLSSPLLSFGQREGGEKIPRAVHFLSLPLSPLCSPLKTYTFFGVGLHKPFM
jgi:hypothetical protein